MSPDLARHQPALEVLCLRHSVRRLKLFGSAATDQDQKGHQ